MSDVHEMVDQLIDTSVAVSEDEVIKARLVITIQAKKTGQEANLDELFMMLGLEEAR